MEKKLYRKALSGTYKDKSEKEIYVTYILEFEAVWPFDCHMIAAPNGALYPVLTLLDGARPPYPYEIIALYRHELL
jgi:hypothetical protein